MEKRFPLRGVCEVHKYTWLYCTVPKTPLRLTEHCLHREITIHAGALSVVTTISQWIKLDHVGTMLPTYLKCDRRRNSLITAFFTTFLVIFFLVRSNNINSSDERQMENRIKKRSQIPKAKIIPFFSALATVEPTVPVNLKCCLTPLPPA